MKSIHDFIIIGAGVMGLSLGLEIRKKHPNASILILEKEIECGSHASGRNSGVLHAGFYYTADSLKAKFTREGCKRWKEYCQEKNIPVNECGKLVVAKNKTELAGLSELLKRGKINNVQLEEISADEAKKIEPRVKTFEKALFSPTTASVSPQQIMSSLVQEAQSQNIKIQTQTQYLKKISQGILTNQGELSAGYIINTSGLYADKIARDFGFSQNYQIVPFKGLYLYSNEAPGTIKTNIYPVPNLNYPFLGVHYTITVEGKIKIGPTAIPSFWREHYQGLENFNANEMKEILSLEAKLFFKNSFSFRKLAFIEMRKYVRSHLVKLASELLENVSPKNYKKWGVPGIRAQLVDLKNHKLEMDFKFEGDNKSFHVLNAVSPAFTCAIPFSAYLFNEIEKLLK